MNIYVFGNPDIDIDNKAIRVAKQLEKQFNNITFLYVDPNEDFDPKEKDLLILDCAMGIGRVEVIEDLDNVKLTHSVSMHDFDLGFNLKLLKKLKKINSIKIIAVPIESDLDIAIEGVGDVLRNEL